MKVLVIPSWWPSEESPVAGVFIQDQVRALATVHDVAVLIPGVSSIHGLWSPPRRAADRTETVDGALTLRAFAQSWVPRSPWASLRTQRRAAFRGYRQLLQSWGRPALIHAHVVLPGGWVAAELGRRHGIPVVLTEHTSPFETHLRRPWMRAKVRTTLAACDALVAIGSDLAEQMGGSAKGRAIEVIGEVLPAGIPVRQPRSAGGPLRIAFVGMLREQKGAAHLLDAVAALAAEGVELQLELAGGGPLRGSLEERARSLGIAKRCHFRGTLPRSEVHALLTRSDLLVVSSLHETFCVAAAEALACGIPVVTTRCGGPEAFVDESNGAVVDAGDTVALAAGITQVAARLESFDGVVLREGVHRRFGTEAFLRCIEPIYRQAIQGRPGQVSTAA